MKFKLKIEKPTLFNREPCAPGTVVEATSQDAKALLSSRKAALVNAADWDVLYPATKETPGPSIPSGPFA